MIDLKSLSEAIELGRPTIVTPDWLRQVALELATGNAAVAELASIRAEREAQA